jgi:hypothetical protein
VGGVQHVLLKRTCTCKQWLKHILWCLNLCRHFVLAQESFSCKRLLHGSGAVSNDNSSGFTPTQHFPRFPRLLAAAMATLHDAASVSVPADIDIRTLLAAMAQLMQGMQIQQQQFIQRGGHVPSVLHNGFDHDRLVGGHSSSGRMSLDERYFRRVDEFNNKKVHGKSGEYTLSRPFVKPLRTLPHG